MAIRGGEIQRREPTSLLSMMRDPLRRMRELMAWDPFGEMLRTTWAPEEAGFAYGYPSFDVTEKKDSYTFRADVPGLKEDDLEISLTGNRLTVSGKREAEPTEPEERYYTMERWHGSFTRTFTLPEGVDADHIKTDFRDGVLSLVIPKKPEVQPKRIAIKAAGKAKA